MAAFKIMNANVRLMADVSLPKARVRQLTIAATNRCCANGVNIPSPSIHANARTSPYSFLR